MLRSLWTAASGMIAQQTSVDTIANNLANVNSTGYKTESTEFKSLLYQNLQARTTSANGEQKPVGAQVGLGARISSVTSHYTQGAFNATDTNTDFAIEGDGFFSVMGTDGDTYYTRNGHFTFAMGTNGVMLCNSEGYPVLDSTGEPIELDPQYETSKITIDADGNLCYPDADNNPAQIGISIGLTQFNNPSGLEKVGTSLLQETAASGTPINEADIANQNIKRSTVKQGYLEASNVEVANEMVNLITAQRAYELNSKAIQAADDMLQQANNLKR